jgi:ABC-2 type transport system permease protein
MNAFSIAVKDLRILARDSGLLIQLFLLPLVFVIGFTLVFSASNGDDVITLPVVNRDGNSSTVQDLVEGLNGSGALEVQLMEESDAMSQVEAGDIMRVLTIPAGFSADLAAGKRATLELVNNPDAGVEQSAAVREVINGVAQDLSLETQLIEAFHQMDQMMGLASEEYQVFTAPRIEAQAKSQFERSRTTPLISVSEQMPTSLVGEQDKLGSQTAVAGFIVLFVFLTAQATAQSVYDEKKVGSFRRLLTAPLSRVELMVGKIIPNFIVTLAQIVIIFAAAVWILPLIGMDRLSLGEDPLAVVTLSLVLALCSTSLGVLIAALARTEGQIGGLSNVGLWVMGALGGAFMPTFLMGDFLSMVGKLVPHGWATEAFYDLLLRGKVLADIGTELAVLAGFTLVFAAVGIWRFEFES